ncbi:MAG: hypothetical protein CTY29_07725 [Methylobacter sp.]|nr:MAG: hypothetical protein CTY29_07725 [Methylobacter sp.]
MLNKRLMALALAALPATDHAASNPWLPEPGTLNTAISYVFQSADRFYFGNQLVDLPADREQHTVGAYLEYGLTDSIALDAFVGYSATDFTETGPGGSAPFGAGLDGLTDTNLGIRWRALDELTGAPVSLTFRAAGIIEGSYRTGALNAVGDGSSGGEFSALAGRYFENGASLSGEFGYRTRSRPVPDEFFANLRAGYAITSKWGVGISYQVAESLGGIDIGAPGFSFARFPETNEDAQIFGLDLSYRFTPKASVSVNWGKNLTGRNTTSQDIVGINFGYSFY